METVIDCVVAPVDHVFPVAEDDVKVTLPPEQKVVGPPAEIVGVVGGVTTVTFCVVETEPLIVNVIVFVPAVE